MKRLLFLVLLALSASSAGFSQKMTNAHLVTLNNDTIKVYKLYKKYSNRPVYKMNNENDPKEEKDYNTIKSYGYTDRKGKAVIFRVVPTHLSGINGDSAFLPLTIAGKNCNQYYFEKRDIMYRDKYEPEAHYYVFENKHTGKFLSFRNDDGKKVLDEKLTVFFKDYPTVLSLVNEIKQAKRWKDADFQKVFEAFNAL